MIRSTTFCLLLGVALTPLFIGGCSSKETTESAATAGKVVTPAEARKLSREAYLFGLAAMESYNTWGPQALDPSFPGYVGGFNRFRHYATLFTPENRDIVTPNNDTPYSWAILDLRAEPVVVSVPEVPEGRYYVLQFIDLFTYNMAYVGSRSTGNGAGDYLVVGPKWKGEIPSGFKKVFRSETDVVTILGRTQLNNAADVEAVKRIQAGYVVRPLSGFVGKTPPEPLPAPVIPKPDKKREATHDFIAYLNALLPLAEPPHPSEAAMRESFRRIGIAPGASWDASSVSPEILAAIDAGIADAQSELKARIDSMQTSNGLLGSREKLGRDYLSRDTGAVVGLYGNDIEEAWYGGWVIDGSKSHKVHFAKDRLPPAKFFWSATLYALPERLLYANALNRYSIGDRTEGVKYDADGGLTIYIGHDSPGADKESNWLPAPAAPSSLVVRLYGPSEAAIRGDWKLPPVEAAE